MKAAVAFLLLATFCFAQDVKRPKITGIDHVDFYTTDPAKNDHFYTGVLGLAHAEPIEPGQTQRYVAGTQWVGYSAAPDPSVRNRMNHAAFATDDAAALKKYLASKQIKVPDALTKWPNGSKSFVVKDPEDHAIEFIQHAKSKIKTEGMSDPVSQRMIHVGFVVKNREEENKFYIDTLGFRPYWHGGMKDDQTDWVALQVPDGSEWLEYMLNIKPDASLNTIGVMNHISLGVADIKQANAKLESHGWTPSASEKMQLGRDGKYQLNVYDPDHTRVELMEFKPAEKPCCSEFTAAHPEGR
ncbi:MAG TPA: VOC family protein [Terriglobales bacterium]|jgi:catechol 2,3-dioxygenase-like lactoylglutathione lyase family enzyme|nr:VOC family protein [Terriglobales bacterium]